MGVLDGLFGSGGNGIPSKAVDGASGTGGGSQSEPAAGAPGGENASSPTFCTAAVLLL